MGSSPITYPKISLLEILKKKSQETIKKDRKIINFNHYVFKKNYNIVNNNILKFLIYENLTSLKPKTKYYWLSFLPTLRLFTNNQELKKINIVINSINLNHKINLLTNLNLGSEKSLFFSLGSTLIRFNILQKSFRRNKKYINLLMSSFKTKLNLIISQIVRSKKNLKTKVYLSIYGPNQSFIVLKDLSVLIDNFNNQLGSYIFIRPLIKNSNNYFKKVKAIKKRIKKKLIKKFYKN